MSQTARDNILNRLRHRRDGKLTAPDSDFSVLTRSVPTPADYVAAFEQKISSVHGQVIHTTHAEWVQALTDQLAQRNIKRLLAPKEHAIGQAIRTAWTGDAQDLVHYDQAIEHWRPELFRNVEAAVTSTIGGIAQTGSLMLWPTPDEPRLMSLVPPVHIAVLDADKLYGTFHQAMTEGHWRDNMPTNALLISGPSKTADIEQTLAYGVHGPKELIVLLRHKSGRRPAK